MERNFNYTNETFSGCDITAQIIIKYTDDNGKEKAFQKTIGELQTVSYSIYQEKKPVRSIGNINAKDYVMGPRTIAGSLVFSVFNKHFAKELLEGLNSNFSGTSYLSDELPPFDIVISAANEYGYRSKLVIYGVRLVNEGQVMSINDVYTENTYQYVATDLQPMTDEMYYIKSDTDNRYKLIDNIPFYSSESSVYNDENKAYERIMAIENYWNKRLNSAIKLTHSVLKTTNQRAIVDFFLSPAQSSGTLYIFGDENQSIPITALKGNKLDNEHNTINYVSTSLGEGNYSAYFENDNNILSDTINFKIKIPKTNNNRQAVVPIIEDLTPSSINVYIDDDELNLVCLYHNEDEEYYEVDNNEVFIEDLDPCTLYTLTAFNEDKTKSSKSISFTTPESNKLYNHLISYLKANKKELEIESINKYISIINSFKDITITPMLSIKKAYSHYTIKISSLNPNDEDYEDKRDELEEKKSICAHILNICSKLDNNYLDLINSNNNIPIPELYFDKNLNYIFQFGKYIDHAEFYQINDKLLKLTMDIDKCSFKTIDDKDNCFIYNGKPGTMNCVYAFIGSNRSIKYEFYVMTNEEKKKYLLNNKNLSQDMIDKINNIIENDDVISNNKERSFMYTAKKINSPLIINPSIIDVNKNETIIKTNLYDFINSLYEKNYYLAIASYNDILENKDIYKVPFRNVDDYIAIDYIYNNIQPNTTYAIWIEDEDNNQISNISTFVMDINNITFNYLYELKDILNDIKSATNLLSEDLKNDIIADISYNDSISPNTIINEIINEVSNNVISKKDLIKFITNIKKYIGPLVDINNSLISNIKLNGNKLSFNSLLNEGNIIIYSNDNIFNEKVNNDNILDLNNYESNLLFIVIANNDLSEKSNIIIVNKFEKYIEVI